MARWSFIVDGRRWSGVTGRSAVIALVGLLIGCQGALTVDDAKEAGADPDAAAWRDGGAVSARDDGSSDAPAGDGSTPARDASAGRFDGASVTDGGFFDAGTGSVDGGATDGGTAGDDGGMASGLDVWPNPTSHTNGDEWIRMHHGDIRLLRPRLWVINFANNLDDAAVRTRMNQAISAMREASRPAGRGAAQLDYQLASLFNLRDAHGGEGAPGSLNSSRFPRSDPGGRWPHMRYSAFFDGTFADVYGDLCARLAAGDVHEIWFVAHQYDGGPGEPLEMPAEVLEYKRVYPGERWSGGLLNRCAGNGCFPTDVPVCPGQSLRIAFFNAGGTDPENFVHSLGHGMEHAARLFEDWWGWFAAFADLELDSRYPHIPFENFYGSEEIRYERRGDGTVDAIVRARGAEHRLTNYQATCGNVHFPPSARRDYDYDNRDSVPSTCGSFGRLTPAVEEVGAGTWGAAAIPFPTQTQGRYLIWWMQHMPGHGTGHRDPVGLPMKSVWPFLFY